MSVNRNNCKISNRPSGGGNKLQGLAPKATNFFIAPYTGRDYSIEEYYTKIASEIGYSGGFKFDLSKPIGMKRKLVDTSILKNMGWESKFSIEEGIKKTYEYYKKVNDEKL